MDILLDILSFLGFLFLHPWSYHGLTSIDFLTASGPLQLDFSARLWFFYGPGSRWIFFSSIIITTLLKCKTVFILRFIEHPLVISKELIQLKPPLNFLKHRHSIFWWSSKEGWGWVLFSVDWINIRFSLISFFASWVKTKTNVSAGLFLVEPCLWSTNYLDSDDSLRHLDFFTIFS